MDKSQERVGANSVNTDNVALQHPPTGDQQQLGAILQTLQEEVVHLRDRVDDQAAAHQKALDDQAVAHQKALDDQAATHQKALDGQAATHEKEREQYKTQIESFKEQIKDLKRELRKEAGLDPKSERNRGSSSDKENNGSDGGGNDNNGSDRLSGTPRRNLTNREKYNQACLAYKDRKKDQNKKELEAGKNPDQPLLAWHLKMGSDLSLVPPSERQMDCPIGLKQTIDHPLQKLSDEDIFRALGDRNGIKKTIVSTNRYGFRIVALTENIQYEVATTRESLCEDGQLRSESCRAGSGLYGPDNTNVTWEGMANALILASTFAIPMERIGRLIGHRYFNAKNISRWSQQCAWHLLPIYLHLFRSMANARVIQMDDTNILVEEMAKLIKSGKLISDGEIDRDDSLRELYLRELGEKARNLGLPPLVSEITELMGRVSAYKNTNDSKASYNLSCVSWMLDPSDTRSTVLFFRTHFGSCANLVSNALNLRSRHNKNLLYLICDASAANNLDEDILRYITVIYQACYHHARRYIKEFEDKDEELASYLLEFFMRLDEYEWEASLAPITKQKVLEARERARKIWTEIKEVCETVIAGKRHDKAKNNIWKEGTKAFNGCRYIVKHFPELTLYLENEFLSGENTFIERALRPQKRIMDAVPNRKSESSQCAFDIMRTMAATCECAGIQFKDYLCDIMQIPRGIIATRPHQYAPYQFKVA